ncbi:hypothetical protein CTZ27_34480 [Streptomyces griseocarneus]|nr:hypothetical protein CTZ27_34480 [Streptomyces griseocarneus]
MDPISAAALAALAGGVGGEAGRQAWQGLSALVRRPFGRRAGTQDGTDDLAVSSGLPELTALEGAPEDQMRAQALATALGVRAALDAEFRELVMEWWRQAQTVGATDTVHNTAHEVHNDISGGTQQTVVQGGNFSHLTFNASPGSTPPMG